MSSSRLNVRYAVLSAAALTSAAAAQPHCQPYWQLAYQAPRWTLQMEPFDDGSGPALYLATSQGSNGQMLRLRANGSWEVIEDGLRPWTVLMAIQVFDDGTGPALYAMSSWIAPNSPIERRVSRWDGSQWQTVWPGMLVCQGSNCTGPQASFDDGNGMAIYGVEKLPLGGYAIVRWTESQWIQISHANKVVSLRGFDLGDGPKLYAIGYFTTIGGIASRGFARWDGADWEDISHDEFGTGGGWRPTVAYDDGTGPTIYSLNSITNNTQSIRGVKRWRNGIWEQVGAAHLPGGSIPITYYDLHVFDDGTGPGLYVTGDFNNINGIPARNIARYDASGWSAVEPGFRGASYMGSLQMDVGPSLIIAQDDWWPPYLAQYVGCPSCYANCDGSTTVPRLTVDDFTCFVDQFAHGMSMAAQQQVNHYANCTANTTEPILTVDDFVCFINRFAVGCD